MSVLIAFDLFLKRRCLDNSVNKGNVLLHKFITESVTLSVLLAKYLWSTEFISEVVPRVSRRFYDVNFIATSEYIPGQVINFYGIKLTRLYNADVLNLQV